MLHTPEAACDFKHVFTGYIRKRRRDGIGKIVAVMFAYNEYITVVKPFFAHDVYTVGQIRNAVFEKPFAGCGYQLAFDIAEKAFCIFVVGGKHTAVGFLLETENVLFRFDIFVHIGVPVEMIRSNVLEYRGFGRNIHFDELE
ncbi:unknown [Ruminococcus sp. CAG:382]|nr:unknown [Ruminococcus sp. CAG:382]